jgi:hypothetical protein
LSQGRLLFDMSGPARIFDMSGPARIAFSGNVNGHILGSDCFYVLLFLVVTLMHAALLLALLHTALCLFPFTLAYHPVPIQIHLVE